MTFDPYAETFSCPRCTDTCNCTHCCARRGETYISARVGKLPPVGSDEARALLEEARGQQDASARTPTPPQPSLGLVPEAYFGMIYGLRGERIGQSWVGKNAKHVFVTTGPSLGKRVVAYIGTRRAPAVPPLWIAAPPPPPPPPSQPTPTAQQDVEGSSDSAAPSRVGPTDTNASPVPLKGGLPLPTPSQLAPQPEAQANAPSLLQVATPRAVTPPPVWHGRLYIGKRAALDSGLYLSMEEIVRRALRQEDEESDVDVLASDPITVDGLDAPDLDGTGKQDAPPPSIVDVQFAIAVALRATDGLGPAQPVPVGDVAMS